MQTDLPTTDDITAAIASAPTGDGTQSDDVVLEEETTTNRRRKFARVSIPAGAYALAELTGRPVDELLQEFVDAAMAGVRQSAAICLLPLKKDG